MTWIEKIISKHLGKIPFIKSYYKFRSSIYGRVVLITIISLFFLFAAFSIIFRSVNEDYMKSVISENGNNIGHLVEGALYQSMLENDQTSLQRVLDQINTMTGIDNVSMYDKNNNLSYTSISNESNSHSDPDCISCHQNLDEMFSPLEKSYRIVDATSECEMNPGSPKSRNLLIRSPILNSPSCYTAACHAHSANEQVLGSVIIKMPLQQLDNAIQKSSTNFFLLASLLTVFLILFLIYFTNKKIKSPLNQIIVASEAVTRGDRSKRLEIKPNQLSDMQMVSHAFNEMLDNIQSATLELENWSQQLEYKVQKKSEELGQAQNELINIERIASLGKLSLSVAHEINNPLGVILGYAGYLEKKISPEDPNYHFIHEIKRESKRCKKIVQDLLSYARTPKPVLEASDLNALLKEIVEFSANLPELRQVHLLTSFAPGLARLPLDADQMRQVSINLILNGAASIEGQGQVGVETRPDGKRVAVVFTDNGSGIPAENLEKIFEPFFTTKARGTGLGLAITKQIIDQHQGEIFIESTVGQGTRVTLLLPIEREEY